MAARDDAHDRVRRWARLEAPAERVWAEIGGFGAVADWHPEVTESPAFDLEGDRCRHLRVRDGGLFLERLEEAESQRYRYAVVDGPAGLVDARGTFSVVAEDDGGCHVYWSLDFPGDPAADDIADGLLDSGVRALARRYAGAR